jgi:hypothetical protein
MKQLGVTSTDHGGGKRWEGIYRFRELVDVCAGACASMHRLALRLIRRLAFVDRQWNGRRRQQLFDEFDDRSAAEVSSHVRLDLPFV